MIFKETCYEFFLKRSSLIPLNPSFKIKNFSKQLLTSQYRPGYPNVGHKQQRRQNGGGREFICSKRVTGEQDSDNLKLHLTCVVNTKSK